MKERPTTQSLAPAWKQTGQVVLVLGTEPTGGEALVSVFTLIVWSSCLAVGVLGLLLPYGRPRPSLKPFELVSLQALQVELKAEPLPTDRARPQIDAIQPSPEDIAPAPLAVARPSPAIAFAVPVAASARIVPAKQAAYSRPSPPPPLAPRVRTLTFGEGEGRQPAPEYPRRALQERQQGVVVLQFVVSENGQVSSAEATRPCPWPALNEAALRTVREKWRFPAGALRLYEIAIRFQLTN